MWEQFFANIKIGSAPWAGVSADKVRDAIRTRLAVLSVPEASRYGTHDFRRGHARDLQEAGVPPENIRLCGGWCHVGSLKPYLELKGLEQSIVLEAAILSDDDEEWVD